MVISAELPVSTISSETPPVAPPVLIPSTFRRPSVVPPPWPPKNGGVGPLMPPTFWAVVLNWIPGTSAARCSNERLAGIDASTSLLITRCVCALCTSTTGASPVTVIVSATAPTCRSSLTVATNAPASSIPSRLTVRNPVRVKVITYLPGGRLTIR